MQSYSQTFASSPNTMLVHGDSITNNGGGYPGLWPNYTSASTVAWSPTGFWCWANNFLGQRLNIVGNSGIPGNTSAQILARIYSDVISKRPGWVHILAGTNDEGKVPVETTMANLTAMWDACDAAGIRIVTGTIPPANTRTSGTTGRAFEDRLNQWILDQGRRRRNLIVVDYFSTLADPSSGIYVGGWSNDGVHPSSIGAAVMGKALANKLSPLIPAVSPLVSAESDFTNLIANGRFQSGGSGSQPTNWNQGSLVGSAPTYSKVARTDGLPGSWQVVTMASGSSMYFNHLSINVDNSRLVVGDSVVATIEYQATGLDQSASAHTQALFLELDAKNGGTNLAIAYDLIWNTSNDNMPAWDRSGVFRTPPLVVPATTTNLVMGVQIYGGGTYSFDRASVHSINRLGVAA